MVQKDTCTPVFIAAIVTIAKTCKQPQFPLTDEWIKKMWYIYTMEYYSAIKKNETIPSAVGHDWSNLAAAAAATWMDLVIIILSEVNQTKKDKYHMVSLICGI